MAFNLRDIVAKIVLKYDRTAGRVAEREASGSLEAIEHAAYKVGRVLIAAFAVTRIVAFAKASVAAAIESEAVWNRVAGSVERSGASWAGVERRVKAAAEAMRDAAGVGDEEFAAAFDRLLGITGDVNKSLNNMGFIADVAARFFGGDLAPAVDLVGKALEGNARGLRSVGILTTDVNEGLRILRERSAGAAANELQSLNGKLKLLTEQAGDAREELGFLILRLFGGDDTAKAVSRFGLGLDYIAERLRRIKNNGLTDQQRADMNAVQEEEFTRSLTPAQRDAREAFRNKPTTPKTPPGPKTEAERFDMQAREQARAMLDREAEERRKQLDNARRQRQNAIRAGDAADGSGLADSRNLLLGIDSETVMEAARNAHREHWDQIQSVAENAAFGIAGAWQDTFELLLTGTANAGDAFEMLGRGMAGSLLGGLAQYASGKVSENVAAAVEELAKGFSASGNPFMAWAAPLHFKSAANHGIAAGLWGVLAGGAGAAQSAVAGGGRGGMSGGIPSGATDIGGRIAQGSAPKAQTIIYIDGFDPLNPVHVRTLGRGMKEVSRTDSSVEVRPRSKATG